MREAFLKRVFSMIKCSVCDQRYEAANIKILGHEDELWFLSAFCSSCRTQCLIAAVVKEGDTAEVIIELTEAEYAKFAQSGAVGVDDVLDMHNFLKEFNGNFADLFSKE